MELFPSQPDLSLQIGLPASATPHAHHHHCAAALSARFLAAAAAAGGGVGVGGGNGVPGGNPAAAMAPSLQLSMPMPLPVQLPMPMPMPPNAAAAGAGGGLYYHPDAAAMLRPIRGMPLYQHPHTHAVPPTFPPHAAGPGAAGPCFCEPCHVAAGAWRRAGCGVGARVAGFPPAKRAARAPRMRWTSTLHARFVHAVELLGGHERESLIPPLPSLDQLQKSTQKPCISWTSAWIISCGI